MEKKDFLKAIPIIGIILIVIGVIAGEASVVILSALLVVFFLVGQHLERRANVKIEELVTKKRNGQ